MLDDVTCLDNFPEQSYFAGRPGRSALIIDDLAWSLSKKAQPSQYELADSHLVVVKSMNGIMPTEVQVNNYVKPCT